MRKTHTQSKTMDKQKGPTLWHRELYSIRFIPVINHNGKIWKKKYMFFFSFL